MKAIISSTYDDLYYFFIPITAWAWNKIGVDVICFLPCEYPGSFNDRVSLIHQTINNNISIHCKFKYFYAPAYKAATYAQCARLYGATIKEIPDHEVLITGDVDMAVFFASYFHLFNHGNIHVIGADLVPEGQYPICYISMSAKNWRDVMWIREKDTLQSKLDDLLGHVECDHFRGNMWAKDQETIYNALIGGVWPIKKHFRAKSPHQFATRRADRDGWPNQVPTDIIDAHLPRPGYTEESFSRILDLFHTMYPQDDFKWMIDYRNEYIKLINP